MRRQGARSPERIERRDSCDSIRYCTRAACGNFARARRCGNSFFGLDQAGYNRVDCLEIELLDRDCLNITTFTSEDTTNSGAA